MQAFKLRNRGKAAALFEGWQETMIWSCLQGVMGDIYADSLEQPASAMAQLGDFCFWAGKPDRGLVASCMKRLVREFLIMVPQNGEWADMLRERYGGRASEVVRYALRKEPDVFDRERLLKMAGGLPAGFGIRMMDEALFLQCKEIDWCKDWVAQYDRFAVYREFGLGALILKDGEIVSGASSYSGFRGGIEIQIDTRKDCRKKGLASACGAKLILECLQRGWYPSWDAQNLSSLALAEKLGYHLEGEYTAFEVTLAQP